MGLLGGATAVGAAIGSEEAPAEPWAGAGHGAARGLGAGVGAMGGGLLGLLGAHAAGVEGPRAIAAATGAGGLLGGIGGYGATARILGDGPFARYRAWRDDALAAMEDGYDDDDDAPVASERRYLPGETSTIADAGDGLRVEGPFPEDSGGAAPRGDSARRNLYLLTGGEAGDVLGYLDYIASKSGTMVENLTTLPAARNKGHARRLMDHFVARHGGSPIFLDAALRDESVDPERLGRFYSRLGFAHEGDGLWIRPASRGEKAAEDAGFDHAVLQDAGRSALGILGGATAVGAAFGSDAAPAEPWAGAGHGAARGLGAGAGAIGGGLGGLLAAQGLGVESPAAIAALMGGGGLLGGVGGFRAAKSVLGESPFDRRKAREPELRRLLQIIAERPEGHPLGRVQYLGDGDPD